MVTTNRMVPGCCACPSGPPPSGNCNDCLTQLGTTAGLTVTDSLYGTATMDAFGGAYNTAVSASGLTAAECAMLHPPSDHSITTTLGYQLVCISSSQLGLFLKYSECAGSSGNSLRANPINVFLPPFGVNSDVQVITFPHDCTVPLVFTFPANPPSDTSNANPWLAGATVTISR